MLIKVEEEMINVWKVSAFGVGCQHVHQFPNDTSSIYHFLFGVGKKQDGDKGKSNIVGLLRAQNGY
jgi:hypothetical protein